MQQANRMIAWLLLAASIMLGAGAAHAADPGDCRDWVAILVSAEGRVEARPDGQPLWRAVALKERYCAGDELRTLENSRAALQLRNDTIVRLDQRAMVKFVPIEPEVPLLLRLLSGKAFFMSRHPRPLTIETPFMNAASGGTEYLIEVDEETGTATLIVIEGVMHLSNPAGQLTVEAGESSVTRAGEAPMPHLAVRPRDVLQWALHFPPVLSPRDLRLDPAPAADWQAAVRASLAAHGAGDIAGAFEALADAPDESDDARFPAYRASLLLSVGRVDEARDDIARSLALAPGNGLARALEALIAVVLNEPERTLQLALDAAATEPDSVSVRIALSYAWQANVNLSEALAAAREATRLDPESALAWARTAELWMSQGYLGEALDAARRAEALNPREARYRTVVGFAHLTRVEVSQAMTAFEAAIGIDSADPMPRLGLGLAKIRKGRLAEGRTDIEIAAVLDPANALVRSYLGKAYYEEKRDPQAAAQFELAKGLDPNDPTAYLYDAIRKQTVNRPVEAMQDLQESVRLNDNRAVYRSRLLLDADLSSRSVSQGRIAEDLGFGQLALSEGWKSVNRDPSNYSAHRFLADSYAAIPNSEIARQSALLTSQLLQPLNSNPMQPSLGDQSAIMPGSGPADPSFNEYTQLFNRNQLGVLASGISGSHDTWGGEVAVTGLYDRYSMSAGQFRYQTDGFRENAFLDQTISNVFVQAALTPGLSVQGEARVSETQVGDLGARFYPDFFSSTLDVDIEHKTYRAGLHYAASPASDFILSALYQRQEWNSIDSSPIDLDPGSHVSEDNIKRARTIEAQYIFRGENFNLVTGAGFYTEASALDFLYSFIIPGFGVFPVLEINDEDTVRHANTYIYSNINLTRKVVVTIGGSFDRLRHESPASFDEKKFNPKLGLIWNPTVSTTLRMAGFRALRRSMISNQTIEPTQVSGFQQFFQDNQGVEIERYGIGIDHKFTSTLSGGVEFTKKELTLPIFVFFEDGVAMDDTSGDTRDHRAYMYWTPRPWLATSMEYFQERSREIDFYSQKFRTHRAPIALALHHPVGVFVKAKGTYIDQRGIFRQEAFGFGEPGHSRFWIWDAQVGYRFPGRMGVLAIGAENILDRRFRFHEPSVTGFETRMPQVQPARFVYARLTLSFN